MSKYTRSGGKFSGNHTTLIPAASTIADIANKCESVYKISPGFIKSGLPSVQGRRRIKISDDKNYILLVIRDNVSQQEVYVYARDQEAARLWISKGAKKAGLQVTFRKP